eukprot:365396-Chlamydomonas_euryale.AAC.10
MQQLRRQWPATSMLNASPPCVQLPTAALADPETNAATTVEGLTSSRRQLVALYFAVAQGAASWRLRLPSQVASTIMREHDQIWQS